MRTITQVCDFIRVEEIYAWRKCDMRFWSTFRPQNSSPTQTFARVQCYVRTLRAGGSPQRSANGCKSEDLQMERQMRQKYKLSNVVLPESIVVLPESNSVSRYRYRENDDRYCVNDVTHFINLVLGPKFRCTKISVPS